MKKRKNIRINQLILDANTPRFDATEIVTTKKNLLHEESLKQQKQDAGDFASEAENLTVFLEKKVQPNNKCGSQKKIQTAREQMPRNAVRFDGYKHYMNFDDPKDERKGYRCKLCGLQTNTYCIKCNVHLCFVRERAKNGQPRGVRNCHMNFHEINEC